MSHLSRRTLFATPLALAATILFAATTSAYAADGNFDKTFTFHGTPTVSVFTGSGYIHISPGPDNQFHIVGHVHTGGGWLSGGNSDETLKHIIANPPVTQTENIITIGRSGDHELYNNVSISYDITTPRSTLLNSHTGSGEIQVSGLSGSVTTETGSGSLHLALDRSGDVHARTGSGSIHIDGADGGLHSETGSGSIEVTGNISTAWELSTGSGSIRVKLPDNARFTLNASTGSGSVHVDQPMVMQGSINHHHITANINGGGPSLRASTGSGDITINGNATSAQLRNNNSLHVPGATDCVDNSAQVGCRR